MSGLRLSDHRGHRERLLAGGSRRIHDPQLENAMSADKQIIRSWKFWAGVLFGIVLTILALSLLGRIDPARSGAADEPVIPAGDR